MRKHLVWLSASVLSLALTACPKDKADTSSEALSQTEARETVDESSVSSQAADITSASAEIATNLTIGGAVEAAAQQVQAFYASQLPCADVSLAGATLTIVYGAKPGNCVFNGHTFTGKATHTIEKNETGEVVVKHAWDSLSNGRV